MNIQLMDFQIKTIGKLIDAMDSDKSEIVLKSPTGSGKTIILTHFMDEFMKGHENFVFVWLTPGKGDLEEQSKEKMDQYIHGANTKLIDDVLTSGFIENDIAFINWERVTKKGNTALKDSELDNLIDKIRKARDEGLSFIVIVDESHQNDTVKSDDTISLFDPIKIIRTSATPNSNHLSTLIEVSEEDVIAEGLIKKMLIINQDFGKNIEVDSQVSFLLEKALDKHYEIKKQFMKKNKKINPLIIIQLENDNELLLDEVEQYLESKKVTYENGLLAVWLSKKKQNLEYIENNDAKPVAIIIKQAIATGWDCPRAHILVKFRENSSETFEIQTIGRVRRMPEAMHYEEDLLDSCYLYTFDEKFTEGVKTNLGKGALDAVKLFLKEEHRNVSLTSELKTEVSVPRDAKLALKVLQCYFEKEYAITTKTKENKTRLESRGFVFSDKVVQHTATGNISLLTKDKFDSLDSVDFIENLSTHKQGREYHNKVGRLGVKLSLPYEQMNTIIRRLFDKNVNYSKKILKLETKEVYSFVINNFVLLLNDIRKALSNPFFQQGILDLPSVKEVEFNIPKEFLLTYDSNNRVQRIYEKNVYKNYLSSAEIRSDSEKEFERFCENRDAVKWVYKNGDKGLEYLSIVYKDNFGKQKSFYPDYVVSINENIWIIETKGGFDRHGNSEDIDRYTAKKFGVLKSYIEKHNLKGGIVRKDKSNNELFICMDEYDENIAHDSWVLLDEAINK